MNKITYCSVDLIDIKQKITSGQLIAKVNMFGSVLLENPTTCEAIQLMMLPENYSFRPKGSWEPTFVYTSRSVDHPMAGHEGWSCSECGWTTDEKYDYCVCGADMKESNKASEANKEFKEFVDTL